MKFGAVLFLIRIMLCPNFPIPIENVLNPPKLILGSALPKVSQLHGFERRRFSNLRVRAGAPAQEEAELPVGLQKEFMPRHVAVIMDGNVRWARRRNSPDSKGHDAGVRSLRGLIDLCYRWEIPVLTVFAFSYDNWLRSKVSTR